MAHVAHHRRNLCCRRELDDPVWWIVSSLPYGAVIFVVVNFVVAPVSRAPMPHHPPHID